MRCGENRQRGHESCGGVHVRDGSVRVSPSLSKAGNGVSAPRGIHATTLNGIAACEFHSRCMDGWRGA